jgi:hypothetical protein
VRQIRARAERKSQDNTRAWPGESSDMFYY